MHVERVEYVYFWSDGGSIVEVYTLKFIFGVVCVNCPFNLCVTEKQSPIHSLARVDES